MATLPNSLQLTGMRTLVEENSGTKENPGGGDQVEQSPQDSSEKPTSRPAPLQLLLPAPGLPTVSHKLAQKIWGLEFIEMEEFLPSNKTVLMLENSASVQQGVLGALQQLQQAGNAKRVGDIMTWLQCYSLYVAVMSKQRAEMVAPMIAHMHRVMNLHTLRGGMLWLQFDWKARRVMNADGPTSWEKCDPWSLFSCFPGVGGAEDPFAPAHDLGLKNQRTYSSGVDSSLLTEPQTPRGRTRRLSKACGLFNKSPQGCHFGEECIYAHRCTVCRSEEHGRRTCPVLAKERHKGGPPRHGN